VLQEECIVLDHFKATSSATTPGELAHHSETAEKSESVPKWLRNPKQFRRDFEAWGYTLVFSFIPFVFVFIFFTGPTTNFAFLELFHDNALFYLCVTMSAFSLYTSEKIRQIQGIHILVIMFGIAAYVLSASGYPVPLFDQYDHRVFVACLFLFSIIISFLTLLYCNMKKGE
jgi:hypothetical protein